MNTWEAPCATANAPPAGPATVLLTFLQASNIDTVSAAHGIPRSFRRARIESNPQRNPQRCKRRGFVRNDVHGNDVGDGSWGDGSGHGRIIYLVQDEKD